MKCKMSWNADADAGSMIPSRNTRHYTLRSVPSSPGGLFLQTEDWGLRTEDWDVLATATASSPDNTRLMCFNECVIVGLCFGYHSTILVGSQKRYFGWIKTSWSLDLEDRLNPSFAQQAGASSPHTTHVFQWVCHCRPLLGVCFGYHSTEEVGW